MVRRMLQETAIRRIWKHSRPSGEVFLSNALKNFGDEEWTFNYLLSLVRPVLTRKTTNWRRPYEPSLRLAVVIWWYATPSEYRTISCLFGVDVYVGWPGRTHDARVLSNSTIFIKAEQQDGYLFPREMSRDINGVEVPVHLIGDAAYPLKKWLMKGSHNTIV
uniref:DDE Tnp4 domain-containing protein n=1 Tax=Nothobranchius kadleci TaxID=1051664 RepID=A0A1A8C4B5_NOTKA